MQSDICSLASVAAAPVGALSGRHVNAWQSSDVAEKCVGGCDGCNEGGECFTGAQGGCCA